MMSEHLAVVLITSTGARLVLIVLDHTGNCDWQRPLVNVYRVIYILCCHRVALVLFYDCTHRQSVT